MTSTTVSVDSLFKDLFPIPGTRIKQWVVDSRRARQWDVETCPRVTLLPHRDNTDLDCRNVPSAIWIDLAQHDCCGHCNDIAETMETSDPAVVAWLAERAARPPGCTDRTVLSDEIAEDVTYEDANGVLQDVQLETVTSVRDHPLLALTRKR